MHKFQNLTPKTIKEQTLPPYSPSTDLYLFMTTWWRSSYRVHLKVQSSRSTPHSFTLEGKKEEYYMIVFCVTLQSPVTVGTSFTLLTPQQKRDLDARNVLRAAPNQTGTSSRLRGFKVRENESNSMNRRRGRRTWRTGNSDMTFLLFTQMVLKSWDPLT